MEHAIIECNILNILLLKKLLLTWYSNLTKYPVFYLATLLLEDVTIVKQNNHILAN